MKKILRGAASVEYVVGVAVLMMAILFIPYDGKNLAEMLYETLKDNYSSFLYGMSIPI